jgi:hypothetical protein
MNYPLFNHICVEVAVKNNYFRRERDALSIMGFDAVHKCAVGVKMLAHDSIADDLDDGYAM